jgi:hypothetical protein
LGRLAKLPGEIIAKKPGLVQLAKPEGAVTLMKRMIIR